MPSTLMIPSLFWWRHQLWFTHWPWEKVVRIDVKVFCSWLQIAMSNESFCQVNWNPFLIVLGLQYPHRFCRQTKCVFKTARSFWCSNIPPFFWALSLWTWNVHICERRLSCCKLLCDSRKSRCRAWCTMMIYSLIQKTMLDPHQGSQSQRSRTNDKGRQSDLMGRWTNPNQSTWWRCRSRSEVKDVVRCIHAFYEMTCNITLF